jgi:hypothetical protein
MKITIAQRITHTEETETTNDLIISNEIIGKTSYTDNEFKVSDVIVRKYQMDTLVGDAFSKAVFADILGITPEECAFLNIQVYNIDVAERAKNDVRFGLELLVNPAEVELGVMSQFTVANVTGFTTDYLINKVIFAGTGTVQLTIVAGKIQE